MDEKPEQDKLKHETNQAAASQESEDDSIEVNGSKAKPEEYVQQKNEDELLSSKLEVCNKNEIKEDDSIDQLVEKMSDMDLNAKNDYFVQNDTNCRDHLCDKVADNVPVTGIDNNEHMEKPLKSEGDVAIAMTETFDTLVIGADKLKVNSADEVGCLERNYNLEVFANKEMASDVSISEAQDITGERECRQREVEMDTNENAFKEEIIEKECQQNLGKQFSNYHDDMNQPTKDNSFKLSATNLVKVNTTGTLINLFCLINCPIIIIIIIILFRFINQRIEDGQ